MIISILSVFILINTILKLSFWNVKYVFIWAIIIGGAVWLMYPYAIEQSQTTINQALNDTKVLGNITILLTIETAICMGFCFTALRQLFLPTRSKWNKILKYYSGLLIFPTLFYILVQSVFIFSGVDFQLITSVVSVGVVILFIGGFYLINLLVPEKDFRLEIHFLTSLFITILGLISTANGSIFYVPQSEPLNIRVLLFVFLLFSTLSFIGFWINKLRWRKK